MTAKTGAQERAKAALQRSTEIIEANAGVPAQQGQAPRTIMEALSDPEQQAQIRLALPKTMDVQRFSRICLTAVRANPQLQQCSIVSLVAACMQSAQLGLEPGVLGHSYLVPFYSTKRGAYDVQFIIGYQGYIELFYRSEKVTSVVAREVCENDRYEQSFGIDDTLRHQPARTDRGDPHTYYGLVRMNNGDHILHVMNLEEIAEHRAQSRAAQDGPWKTHERAMSRKTVIRAMVPFVPKTAALADAVIADESVPTAISEHMAEDLLGSVPEPEADEVIDVPADDGEDGPPSDEGQAQVDHADT